jgi:2-amino-4-hydroxy-6-hydroxymethyldihydropteridine diphosphokinase
MKKIAYLSLGSNVGDRRANIAAALGRLERVGKLAATSSLYETEPVEFARQPWFLNCVVGLQTELMPKQLLAALLGIEKEMGRLRKQGPAKGPRTMDIDILLFGNSTVNAAGLTIPHRAMHERRFVLEPLAEIAPEVVHPVLKQTVRELRDQLPPGAAVKRLAAD